MDGFELIEKLNRVYNQKGATLYNICFRYAGWGIQLWEEERQRQGKKDNFRDGLVIYHYYPTLEQAVRAELERMAE